MHGMPMKTDRTKTKAGIPKNNTRIKYNKYITKSKFKNQNGK